MASRSDDGEGFTIRKREDSRPLSVALRAPALPKESLSIRPAHNSKLAKLWIVWYIRYRKDNRPQRWVADRAKKNPLRTRQSFGAVFLCP